MAQGRLTAEELAEHLLERIAALDVGPSGLRSLLEVNPRPRPWTASGV
jgi:Asp-tRNA(Asn)/Glu-tRNA(Gln) amidotransferase A subunit family amidase